MLNLVLTISFMLMMAALLFAVVRLYQGPGSVDRIIIFDLFSSIAIGIMAIAFLWLGDSAMLDVGLLLSAIAFIGTIGFARFIEARRVK